MCFIKIKKKNGTSKQLILLKIAKIKLDAHEKMETLFERSFSFLNPKLSF